MTTYYRIEDFSSGGFKYNLSDDVRQVIALLESSITPTDESKTQTSSVQSTNRRKPKPATRVDDWNVVRTVAKPIVKVEVKEKTIKDIRIALNKFTVKNADTQKDTIVELIRQVQVDDTAKVTDMIFDVVSSNGFYSELYVKLYKHLISQFPFFGEKLPEIIGKYRDSFNNIVAVDPNVDYDAYCVYTKQNDLRKSMTMFIVNLVRQDVLDKDGLIELLVYLEESVLTNSTDSAKLNTNEELVDNIYIIVTESKAILNQWSCANIINISQLRKTDAVKYAGMSNRSTFKVMDILDNIK